MKIIRISILLMLIPTFALFAQNDTIGWGRNSNYNRNYDPQSTIDLKGEILAIEPMVPMKGMSSGIHITVRSEGQTTSVHLGPKWYLDKQAMQFKVKDVVEIKGSKVVLEGKQVVIAREIIKDGKVLELRDEDGFPVWAGKKGR